IERLAGKAPRSQAGGTVPADVEIVVSAADEEDVIEARMRNLLEQEAPVAARIALGCDGCRDRTAALAPAALGGRGRGGELEARRGKSAVLNDLIARSTAEVLVFTDANTRFDPGAVRELLRPFADSRVGAVCGRLVLESPRGEDSETVFWNRETRVKEAEGRLGACLGAHGASYAARRN